MAKFLISGTCARRLSKDLHRCACFDTASALLNFHRPGPHNFCRWRLLPIWIATLGTATSGLAAKGRRIEIEPGKPLVQRHCSRCRRDFVEDPATGERYAVYVSVFRFRKLPDLDYETVALGAVSRHTTPL